MTVAVAMDHDADWDQCTRCRRDVVCEAGLGLVEQGWALEIDERDVAAGWICRACQRSVVDEALARLARGD